MEDSVNSGGTVLLHWAAGISRSGSMMVAYVMVKEKMTFEDALKYVQERRKKVCPNEGFVQQLKKFEKEIL